MEEGLYRAAPVWAGFSSGSALSSTQHASRLMQGWGFERRTWKSLCCLDFHNCKTGDTSYLTPRKDCENKCFESAGSCSPDKKNLLPEPFSFIKWCLPIYTKLLTFSVPKRTLYISFSYLCLGGVSASWCMFKLQTLHGSSASLLVFPTVFDT